MKKLLFILAILSANIAFANPIDSLLIVTVENPPAPQSNWVYAALVESKSFQTVCAKAFQEKCSERLQNIPASTTDNSEKAQRKFATALLDGDEKAIKRAVQHCANSSTFADISDGQNVYDQIRSRFDNDFVVIALANF